MRRILLIGAAIILSLALVSTVQAGHGGGHGHGGQGGRGGQIGGQRGSQRGARVGGGRARSGRRGHRWRSRYFDRRYGCNVFLCAEEGCWYYWCPPDDCYYPIGYCPYGTYSWDDEG
jgi:hypothetical protein